MFFGRILDEETLRITRFILQKYGNVCQVYLQLNARYNETRITSLSMNKFLPDTDIVQYINPRNILKILTRCETENKRFFVIALNLIGEESSHQNMLIYDTISRSLERFDPNTITYTHLTDIDQRVFDYFNKLIPVNEYFSPVDYCPVNNLQTIESQYKSDIYDLGGYCVAWSFFYLAQRLENPDVPRDQLIMKLTDSLYENKFGYKYSNPKKARDQIVLFWNFLMHQISSKDEFYRSQELFNFLRLTENLSVNSGGSSYQNVEYSFIKKDAYISHVIENNVFLYTDKYVPIKQISFIYRPVYTSKGRELMFVISANIGLIYQPNWIVPSFITDTKKKWYITKPENNFRRITDIIVTIEKYLPGSVMKEDASWINQFIISQSKNYNTNRFCLLCGFLKEILVTYFSLPDEETFFHNIDDFITYYATYKVNIYSRRSNRHYSFGVPVTKDFIFEGKKYSGTTIVLLSIINEIKNNNGYNIDVITENL